MQTPDNNKQSEERSSRKNSHGSSRKKKIGMAVALTTAAAAIAGAYFLYGSKNAEQNRTKVKSWMLKARAEVLEKLEKTNIMSREEYEAFVDSVAARYARFKSATQSEIHDFKREMKNSWPELEDAAKGTAKVAGKAAAHAAAKDVAGKVARQISKKRAKKQSSENGEE